MLWETVWRSSLNDCITKHASKILDKTHQRWFYTLCDEPDAFFLQHMALFKHTIDTENIMALTVASIRSTYWKIPFRLVLS